MLETWKPVVGFEDLYEVSDLGGVRSLDRVGVGGRLLRGKILRACVGKRGYRQVSLFRVGEPSAQRKIHVLVLTAFAGPRPLNLDGCHNDGDKSNNSFANLRWDTRSSNHEDKRAHGTLPIGTKCHNAKLDPCKVLSIRRDQREILEIAADYGVSKSLISLVRLRKVWAHVQDNSPTSSTA